MVKHEVLLTQLFQVLVIVQLILRHSPSLLLNFIFAGNSTKLSICPFLHFLPKFIIFLLVFNMLKKF